MSRRPNRPAQRRGGRPATRAGATRHPARPVFTPVASPFRQAVERRSLIVVAFLRGLPRPVPGLLVLGLVAGGLLLPGPAGAAFLVAVALLLAWLVFLSWPAVPAAGRAVRMAVLAVVVGGAVARLLA